MPNRFSRQTRLADGDFNFAITILPGDISLTNTVSVADFSRSNAWWAVPVTRWQILTGTGIRTRPTRRSGRKLRKESEDLVFANFNNDGFVNSADLGILSANYNTTEASHADGDATETATWMLMIPHCCRLTGGLS